MIWNPLEQKFCQREKSSTIQLVENEWVWTIHLHFIYIFHDSELD